MKSAEKVSVKQAGEALRARAQECIDSSQPVTVPEMQVGQMWAQGDVGVLKIDGLPAGARPIKMSELAGGQVAPGNTQGSRHCIDAKSREKMKAFRVNDGDQLSDLVVQSKKSWTLEHPEHAHVTFPPGTFRIVHQQNELRQRVLD